MNRLRPKDVAPLREKLRKRQGGYCPLCNKKLSKKDATLDHDHGTGHVRMVLHRNCNAIEGRVLHWARRSGINPLTFLTSIVHYWGALYTFNPIHPNHKTPKEKEILNLKRKMRRLKTEKGKQKYRDKIKELRASV